MKQTLIPIDQAGRIVLPKNVRDELAIKSGDTFAVTVNGSSVTLTPEKRASGLVRKGKSLVFVAEDAPPLTDDDISSVLRASREERDVFQPASSGARKRQR